jgi:hypothetical protein
LFLLTYTLYLKLVIIQQPFRVELVLKFKVWFIKPYLCNIWARIVWCSPTSSVCLTVLMLVCRMVMCWCKPGPGADLGFAVFADLLMSFPRLCCEQILPSLPLLTWLLMLMRSLWPADDNCCGSLCWHTSSAPAQRKGQSRDQNQ